MIFKKTTAVLLCFAGLFFISCGDKDKNGSDTDILNDTDPDADIDIEDEDAIDENRVESIEFNIPDEMTEIAGSSSNHYAFPDIVKLSTGGFMLVYRMGSGHAEYTGKIIAHYSDDALKWSDPEVLMDDNSIDDRDPSIAVLSDGSIAMNWFRYRYPADYTEPWMHHIMFSAGNKSGTQFKEAVQVDEGVFDLSGEAELNDDGIWIDGDGNEVKVYASSSSVVESDGSIIIPAYGGNSLNFNSMSKTPKGPVVFFISSDGGTSWKMEPVEAQIPEYTWVQEPALLKIDEKKWILQVRTAYGASPGAKGDLMQSVSNDGGLTWSAYKSLGFVAHAPELIRLDNGVIVSSFRWLDWGFSLKREAVSMIYSLNNGEAWSDVIEIFDCGLAECGYPGMVELDNDRLAVVYYLPGGAGIGLKVIDFNETLKFKK